MTMTQRYAGMLRRHAGEWDKQGMPVQAEATRQAARHMEEVQAAKDAIVSPWQSMRTAPKDVAILVLLDGSDVPHAVRWIDGRDSPHAVANDPRQGWHMTWDNWFVEGVSFPRYWMAIPDDPDA